MGRTLALLLTICWPFGLAAQCAGSDIRGILSDAARSEIAAAVAAEPFAEGNAWRATRGAREITLVGTVHVDDPRLDPIAAALEDDISGADVVYLEMTAAERGALETRLAEDPEMIVLAEGSLIDLLPPDTWELLAEAAGARGLPAPMAARLQPWYLSLVLALPPCLLTSGTVPEGLDARIEARAEASQIPTRALEPYDTLFALFADAPLDVQIDLLSATVMDNAASEDMLATTMALYFEQAHAELWHLSRIAARSQLNAPEDEIDAIFAELEETLLIARNQDWIGVLDAAPEDRILAAFGAAHLFGDDGVLNLLSEAGYALTRIQP